MILNRNYINKNKIKVVAVLDITTIVGMIVCIVVVFFGIITGVDGFAGIPHFVILRQSLLHLVVLYAV